MDVLNSLKDRLQQCNEWPILYMFKFIVPSDIRKVAMVEALFEGTAIIYRKESTNGNFISITAKQQMYFPQQVIDIYRKAAKIDNIMAL